MRNVDYTELNEVILKLFVCIVNLFLNGKMRKTRYKITFIIIYTRFIKLINS